MSSLHSRATPTVSALRSNIKDKPYSFPCGLHVLLQLREYIPPFLGPKGFPNNVKCTPYNHFAQASLCHLPIPLAFLRAIIYGRMALQPSASMATPADSVLHKDKVTQRLHLCFMPQGSTYLSRCPSMHTGPVPFSSGNTPVHSAVYSRCCSFTLIRPHVL